MLNPSSITEAKELVNAIATQGRYIKAKGVTPVDSLIRANTTGDLAHAISNVTDFNEFSELVSSASRVVSRDGAPEHDLASAEFVEKAAGVIAVNLDLAKNTVVPHVLDVLQRVTELADLTARRELNNIAIVPDHYESIWDNPGLNELIEPYANTAPADEVITSVLGALPSLEEATKWMTTGSAIVDADILELIKHDPELPLRVVQGTFFEYLSSQASLSVLTNPYKTDRVSILARFLIANHLLSVVPAEANVPLAEFKRIVVAIMVQSAVGLHDVIKLRKRAVDANQLLRSYPVTEFNYGGAQVNIDVNGTIYNRFLEAGGSPESIMGAFITDRSVDSAKLISEKETYEKAWAQYVKVRSEVLSEQRYNRTVAALRSVLAADIKNLPESYPVNGEILYGRAGTLLNEILPRDLEGFPAAVRDIVCKLFYAHTNVLIILSEMDRIKAKFPLLPMDEVATEAVTEFITDWVEAQLDLNPLA